MDASAKLFVALDAVPVEIRPALVDDGFEPQPARIAVSAIVTIQLAMHPTFFTTGTLRDVPAPRRRFARCAALSEHGVVARARSASEENA
jgi:hypothetical protein